MSLQTFMNSEANTMLCLNTRNYDERINRLKSFVSNYIQIPSQNRNNQRPKSGEDILTAFLARFVKNKGIISDILNYRIGVDVVTEKIEEYNEIILPILPYIQSHLEKSLSLEQLSQKAGLSLNIVPF